MAKKRTKKKAVKRKAKQGAPALSASSVDRTRVAWFDARPVPANDDAVLPAVYNTNLTTLLVSPDQLGRIHCPRHFKQVLFTKRKSDIAKKADGVLSPSRTVVAAAQEAGMLAGLYVEVHDAKTLQDACRCVESDADFTVVHLRAETNIPLELLLAKAQQKRSSLLKVVPDATEAQIAFGVMESGSDGVVLSSIDVPQIVALNAELESRARGRMVLQEAVVESITHIGMGDRACVDTTSLLTKQEGMIVGSTSQGGIFVCSETHHLPFMRLREFRVNAGAVHSYIWAPKNTSAYLADIEVGDPLMAVNVDGETRTVTLGRVKIERRPLLLIKATIKDKPVNAIIQDDWHVRVMGAGGRVRPCTTLKKGDKLLGYLDQPGRHVGIKIDESIQEK